MPKTRPPYPTEFRQQMIELAGTGRTPAELSREFNVSAQTISNWVAQAARDRGQPLPSKEGLSTAEREEVVRLRRQLKRVHEERDILAKATAWFAARNGATSTPSSDSLGQTRPPIAFAPSAGFSASRPAASTRGGIVRHLRSPLRTRSSPNALERPMLSLTRRTACRAFGPS